MTTTNTIKIKNASIANLHDISSNSFKHSTSLNYDKKKRDFIGENLLDIEKTLKALNLDYMQNFNDLEKTDSAETLFGDSFTYDNTKLNSSALKISKLTNEFNLLHNNHNSSNDNISMGKNEGTAAVTTAITEAVTTTPANPMLKSGCSSQSPPVKLQDTIAKLYSEVIAKRANLDKRSKTPDTNFSPKESNLSSRRSSGRSSYSPQDTNFSPREFNFHQPLESRNSDRMYSTNSKDYLHEFARSNSRTSSSPPVKNINSSQNSIHSLMQMYNTPLQSRKFFDETNSSKFNIKNRQRSMSFTENYELNSPTNPPDNIQMMVHQQKQDSSQLHSNYVNSNSKKVMNKPRNIITYKPKSIRARNLRRLSYNPINMIDNSSSSSDDDSEFDKSIAHSECDIRTKMLTSRRRRQYLNRKTSNTNLNHDKLYGSNASIKSAPQYNNFANERQPSYAMNKNNNGGGSGGNNSIYLEETLLKSSYNEFDCDDRNIYDFGSNIINSNYLQSLSGYNVKKNPQPKSAIDRELLFSEFDVTKLTGKSPTTPSYFDNVPPIGSYPADSNARKLAALESSSSQNPNNNNSQSKLQPFQWPEKIHASAVKQNDIIWQRRGQNSKLGGSQQLIDCVKMKQRYISDTSSTETDSIDFRQNFKPWRPPSPAP